MPGNSVVINGSKGLTWYVGDSKMDELMEFLHKIGFHQQPKDSVNKSNNVDVPLTTPSESQDS